MVLLVRVQYLQNDVVFAPRRRHQLENLQDFVNIDRSLSPLFKRHKIKCCWLCGLLNRLDSVNLTCEPLASATLDRLGWDPGWFYQNSRELV